MALSAPELQRLGKELLQEPVKRVNNVSKLLKALSNGTDEVLVSRAQRIVVDAATRSSECDHDVQASVRSALQYLKLYFLASFENDILSRQVWSVHRSS